MIFIHRFGKIMGFSCRLYCDLSPSAIDCRQTRPSSVLQGVVSDSEIPYQRFFFSIFQVNLADEKLFCPQLAFD